MHYDVVSEESIHLQSKYMYYLLKLYSKDFNTNLEYGNKCKKMSF